MVAAGLAIAGVLLISRWLLLEAPGWRFTALAWSPDGGRLAMLMSRRGGGSESAQVKIWVVGPDTCAGELADEFDEVSSIGPPLVLSWSPDSRAIAYLRPLPETEERDSDVVIWRVGSGRTTAASDNYSYWYPVWSPYGYLIAYFTFKEGPKDVAEWLGVLDIGRGEQKEYPLEVQGMEPQWSPTGDEVGFLGHQRGSGVRDIYALNLRSGRTEHVTQFGDVLPQGWRWGQNGGDIFVIRRVLVAPEHQGGLLWQHHYELWRFEMRSKKAQKLVSFTDLAQGRQVTWSVDGQRIAYILGSEDHRLGNLTLVDIRDGSKRVLTSGAHDSWPAWRPSTAEIAFVRNQTEVWIYDLSTHTQRKLLDAADLHAPIR
jgi:Tol biopolymer transport system component